MRWLVGCLILAAIAWLLRRILRMDGNRHPPRPHGALRRDLQQIYYPIALEIETHTSILGITLNEAFDEREAARHEMAWHVVRLAVGEWDRLTELVEGLHSLLAKFLSSTEGLVVVRRVAVGHFKSRAVVESVALYEFLDQVLLSSKRRFALKLRVLSRTSALLGTEFRRACREGERTLDTSNELWTRLDYHFHDFDLIAKESLLALRTLLACQTAEGAQDLARELQTLLNREARVSLSPARE